MIGNLERGPDGLQIINRFDEQRTRNARLIGLLQKALQLNHFHAWAS